MESAQASMSTSLKPFAYFDQDSSSWKTYLRSGRVGSGKSSPTWPRSGMTHGGHAYELPTLERHTTGIDGSLLPTPKASDGPHGGPNQRNSKGQYDALPGMVVNCLPTPTARDWKSGASNLHGTNSRPLNEVVLVLKTPTAQLGTNGAAQHPDKRRGGGTDQPSMTKSPSFFPTPTASDGTGGPGTSPSRKGGMNLRTAVTHLPSGGETTSLPSDDGKTS